MICGIIFTAGYSFWTVQRILFGRFWIRESNKKTQLIDLSMKDLFYFIPWIFLMIIFISFSDQLMRLISSSLAINF